MRGVLSVLWVLFVLCHGVLTARASDATDRTVRAWLLARGATSAHIVHRVFAFERGTDAVAQVTDRAGCVGFLVLGGSQIWDVDVVVHSAFGLPLAEDLSTAPYGYVRVCTEAGVALVLATSMYAGRGELTVWRAEQAPRELGPLPSSLGLAVTPGGRFEPAQALGAPLNDGGLSSQLLVDEARYFVRGYVALGGPEALELRLGEAETTLLWAAGHCYRVDVRAPGMRGVTVTVEDTAGVGSGVQEPTRERVELAYCADHPGPHRVRVRARAVRGMVVWRVFEHPGARPAAEAERALGEAELGHVLGARGLSLTPLGLAWVESRTPSRFVADLTGGECYAAAAVSASRTPLELRVVDGDGRVASRSEGRDGMPIAYTCPAQSGAHEVVLTGGGIDQKVAVWLAGPSRNVAGLSP